MTSTKISAIWSWLKFYFALLYWGILRLQVAKIFGKISQKDACLQFGVKTCKKFIESFGLNVQVIGLERWADVTRQQAILISNHRSFVDQVVVAAMTPAAFTMPAHERYLKMPLLGSMLKNIGFIKVQGGHLTEEEQQKLDSMLTSGWSFYVFPEGTRGSGQNLLPFRGGAFRMAARTNAPILPIYLFNTEYVLSKNRSLLEIKKPTIYIVVGEPMKVSSENLEADSKKIEAKYREDFLRLCAQYDLGDQFIQKRA